MSNKMYVFGPYISIFFEKILYKKQHILYYKYVRRLVHLIFTP